MVKANGNNQLAYLAKHNAAPTSAMDAAACTGNVRHSRFAFH